MYKMYIVIIAIIAIITLIGVMIIVDHNSLVTLRKRTQNAWSQIEVQLQKRYDLIPNLVETVKGYTGHELTILQRITEIRSSSENAKTLNEKANEESEISTALRSIMAVAENYPELKSNENFILLQTQLNDIESKIVFSRQFYNDIVTRYNTKLELFPSNIAAAMFGFKAVELFSAESAEAKANMKITF